MSKMLETCILILVLYKKNKALTGLNYYLTCHITVKLGCLGDKQNI